MKYSKKYYRNTRIYREILNVFVQNSSSLAVRVVNQYISVDSVINAELNVKRVIANTKINKPV